MRIFSKNSKPGPARIKKIQFFLIISLFCVAVLTAAHTARAGIVDGTYVNEGVWNISAGYDNDPLIISSDGILTNNGQIGVFNCRTGPGWYPDWGVTLDNKGELLNAGTLAIDRGMYDFYGMRRRPGQMNSSGILNNTGTLNVDGTLNNLSPGTLNNQNLMSLSRMLNNYGTINNTGTLDIVSLWFDSGYGHTKGTLNNFSGGRILSSGTLNAYGDINNSGNVNTSGQTNLLHFSTLNNSGIWENSGTMENGHYCTINNTGYLHNYGTINNYNGFGIVSGDWPDFTPFYDTIDNSGFMYNLGTINNYDRIINRTDAWMSNFGTLNIISPVDGYGQRFQAVFENYGWLNNYGTIHNSDTLNNDGTLNNYSQVLNNGQFQGTGSYNQLSGETINNGTMIQSSIQIIGGTLGGSGTITGNVVIGSGGTLSPGNSPGTLTINGDFYSSGSLVFEIGGLNADYDILKVNGGAFFSGGNIEFNFINGFEASAGDFWDFLIASSIIGWDNLTFSFKGLGAGLVWSFESLDNGGKQLLITQNNSPVPEPATVLLFGFGLLGVAGANRRKK